MKLDIVAGSNNDEWYTPQYAVLPIIEYLPNKVIWCPFDTEDSNFVKLLRRAGFTVVASHVDDGYDFFNYQPNHWDIIVSNPPYSKKTEVLERCFSLSKPFALLLGEVGLFESKKRFNMFKDNKFEILRFDKRIGYFNSTTKSKSQPPYSSVYITSNILPQQIIFHQLDKRFDEDTYSN